MFYSFFSLSTPAVYLVSNFTVLLDSQKNIVDIWELAKMLQMNIHIDRKIVLLGRNVKRVCYPTPCTYSATFGSSLKIDMGPVRSVSCKAETPPKRSPPGFLLRWTG